MSWLSKISGETNHCRAWARLSDASYALPLRKHIAEDICQKNGKPPYMLKNQQKNNTAKCRGEWEKEPLDNIRYLSTLISHNSFVFFFPFSIKYF